MFFHDKCSNIFVTHCMQTFVENLEVSFITFFYNILNIVVVKWKEFQLAQPWWDSRSIIFHVSAQLERNFLRSTLKIYASIPYLVENYVRLLLSYPRTARITSYRESFTFWNKLCTSFFASTRSHVTKVSSRELRQWRYTNFRYAAEELPSEVLLQTFIRHFNNLDV